MSPQPVVVEETEIANPYQPLMSAEDKQIIAASIRAGLLVQAKAMLNNAAEFYPEDASFELQLLRAELAIAENDFDRARQLVRYPDIPMELQCRVDAVKGQVAYHAGYEDASVILLSRAVRHCDDDWRSWNLLAIILSDNDDYRASNFAFRNAIKQSQGSAEVRANYAFSLMQQRLLDEALREMETALLKEPDNQRFQNNRDILSGMMGERPLRLKQDSKQRWAERLNNAGYGASLSGYSALAEAMFADAVMTSPVFNKAAWSNLKKLEKAGSRE